MRILVCLALLLLLATPAMAVDLRFDWVQDRVLEVTGWNIYWTTTSGSYTPTDLIVVATSCTDLDSDDVWDCSFDSVGDLPDGDYFFVLTAFNQYGESGQSPEIAFLFQGPPPADPRSFGVQQL